MKKIIFSILLLWISTTAFGQTIDWSDFHFSAPPGGTLYHDNSTLYYDSGDGKLSFTYELLHDGRTLNYEINVNVPTSSSNYWFYSGAYEDDYMGAQFWNLDYPSYALGTQTFSGSIYLDYTAPTPVGFHTGIETTSGAWESWGGLVFATYYPPN
ncbi:hypothetical protein [Sphingobacterium sp. LRF_L2]|uniref:hypothetical protein n=1 Tax=Sphingobacterium sp. LRF_L2 TaxID=3369421 RepID=UPI003F61BB58